MTTDAEITSEQAQREHSLLTQVLASFGAFADTRLKQSMEALTGHLHAFLWEVRLTADEWWRATESLAETGHITDGHRQEFILLSDVLGASMQTIAINKAAYKNATEATAFGPFFVEGALHVELGDDIAGIATESPAGSKARSLTPTVTCRPALGSKSGRQMTMVDTMSSMKTVGW